MADAAREEAFFREQAEKKRQDEEKKLKSMDEEQRAKYLAQKEAEQQHDNMKSRHLKKTQAAFGAGAKAKMMGGRGRGGRGRGSGAGRGMKHAASVGPNGNLKATTPPLPRSHSTELNNMHVSTPEESAANTSVSMPTTVPPASEPTPMAPVATNGAGTHQAPTNATSQTPSATTHTTPNTGSSPASSSSASVTPPTHTSSASSGKPVGSSSGSEDPLPPNWTEMVDDASGRQYFWNCCTGETKWHRPYAGTMPPGWKPVKDPTSGNTYYWNTKSGERAWIRPTDLPPHWEERKDDASQGKVYYWNAETGESRWDKPTA